ncbi:sterile affecting ciliogenesis [Haematobia irritans]|uniref:sterile affecting ciliogenesis n=1 Tax=Haematobia irritans TaxID=7368 RepID=UPI003F4F489D
MPKRLLKDFLVGSEEVSTAVDRLHHDLTEEHGPRACEAANKDFGLIPKELTIEKEKLPKYNYPIAAAQKWLAWCDVNGRKHYFPLKTILPKVQWPIRVPAKQLPRDVVADRRREMYDQIDIGNELKKAGVTSEELLPTEEQFYVLSENNFKHFLPLNFFDDFDYDCHTPEAWLQLGEVPNDMRYPLPAKAYLPANQSLMEYAWQNAAVSDYNRKTEKWSVRILANDFVYQVPRIQIMFRAENPWLFVKRVKQAVEDRNKAECLSMVESIVNSVLQKDMRENHYYAHSLVDKLMVGVHTDSDFYWQLYNEVYMIHERLMLRYELNNYLKNFPHEFRKISRDIIEKSPPKVFHSRASESEIRSLKSMAIPIFSRRHEVLAYSLYYTPEGYTAMANVAGECLYIESLRIFMCNFNNPMTLSDFLKSQQQQSTQVSNYLKNEWPSKIAFGITSILRVLGKGWLDILIRQWSVYEMCKIFRFVVQVKLRMEESMQNLLEKSLKDFFNLLCEPCKPFLKLDDNYEWTSDYIISEFPFPKAIFSLVISITEDMEVVYSTQPEEFAPALKEVFKKSLEKTNGVRQVDAETLTNLKFPPNLYILTVELIEYLYIPYNDLLEQCYLKAISPLRSYGRKYNRFIDFYLLHIPTYMAEYKAAQKPSLQVKNDILEHKRCKEEMRTILPDSITLGPFHIIVEPMKQYMIGKRIELVKRIFEYYVDRMYDTNDRLLERCRHIYNRIDERPQSIEHLFEIQDFASTIPDLVDQLRADIQVMWMEYDLLDSFFYNLPDHQFAMKWEAYAWPKNILDRLSTLRDEQKLDMEEFKRLHLSECICFEERLESLNDEIQQFSLQFNPKKVVETAVEVKKTWKIIQDLQRLGETLRYRQELFELEEFSLEFLENIVEGFLPYKILWYACQDLVKLEEATVGNPIANVELDDVWDAMQVINKSLHETLEVFSEKPEIQNVAHYFLQVMKEFLPKYNAIKDLKNDNWLHLHWQELGLRSGMDIKFSMAMNFQYCMRKGIMEHLELVHDISIKATNEADAIRKAWEEEEMRKEQERQAIIMRKAMRKCRRDIL